ncbi:MAG: cyclase family protein [Gulosibacter sp.]|uniref:cyclase family protein n=1 Tax=Gulosibacter sp. TaxID=2817531 RepID=UPI003F929720
MPGTTTEDTLADDPMAPWVRGLAATHHDKFHEDGIKCRGSISFIDEEARLRGAAQFTLGKAISLERVLETRPEYFTEQNPKAIDFNVEVGIYGRSVHGGDVVQYNAHGTGKTHLDGLGHIGVDETWHGGVPASASETDEDTMVNWAQHGVATRAVLLDIPAVRNAEWVEAGEPVTAAELDAAVEAAGVTLEPGDALLIYQGRDRFEAAGHSYPSGAKAFPRPGIGEEGAKWIAEQNPGLLLWDFHDARNNAQGSLEVHSLIFAIGLCIIDNCDLAAAAHAFREANVSTGLLVAAPLAIHRSTGVLINPLVLY